MQFARGATEEARRSFELALEYVTNRSLIDEYEAHARLAILEAGDGRVDEAAKHIGRCEELLDQGNGWRGYRGFVPMASGTLAVAGGRIGEAEARFTEAIEIFNKFSLRFETAETLYMWGRALRDGDARRAVEKYDAALEIYTSRGIGQAWIDRALADRRRAE
jgi:tetratricopeptide (TPR) repeat protein